MKGSAAQQIRQRIEQAGKGTLFLVRDFIDLTTRSNIDVVLQRLTKEGMLQRLHHGLYHYPRVNTLLGQVVPPTPEEIAMALARRTGVRVSASRAQTANNWGLTTQVPAKNVFVTNGGKTRRLTVGNQSIELRPVTPSHFQDSEASSLIQALRFVGEGNVTEEMIVRLKNDLTESAKEALREDWSNAPVWMHTILQEIAHFQQRAA
jgi:predicted transcriptional regulator of viral defense system